MELTQLTALSPIDGRYLQKTVDLMHYFSEEAIIKYRIKVEIEYFIALCRLPLPQLAGILISTDALRDIYRNFSNVDAHEIKEIEKTTNHDVKAVEYFIKRKFDIIGLSVYKEFIHFGLTSQDVNNTAIPLALKESWKNVMFPMYIKVIRIMEYKARSWKKISLLGRTHGQPAVPTSMGKEIYVFVDRFYRQINLLEKIPISAKFGGAVGNFNAHHVSYPDFDWVSFADKFVNFTLGMSRSKITSQIDHYDCISAFLDNIKRINVILLDFCRDMWSYISMGYFKQKVSDGEIGSSAMPHKINPINFENAEGNFGIANVLFEYLSSKLPVSRLQRDLTDSTVIRNIGVPMGHSLVALKSIKYGIGRLVVNKEAMLSDLYENWAVVSEGIQTILRREGYDKPYEKILSSVRSNDSIDYVTITDFISKLDVSDEVKNELMLITPISYKGIYDF